MQSLTPVTCLAVTVTGKMFLPSSTLSLNLDLDFELCWENGRVQPGSERS